MWWLYPQNCLQTYKYIDMLFFVVVVMWGFGSWNCSEIVGTLSKEVPFCILSSQYKAKFLRKNGFEVCKSVHHRMIHNKLTNYMQQVQKFITWRLCVAQHGTCVAHLTGQITTNSTATTTLQRENQRLLMQLFASDDGRGDGRNMLSHT